MDVFLLVAERRERRVAEMANPPRIKNPGTIWKQGTGQDTAAYLVDPGSVISPGKHRAGNLGHARPYLVNGAKMFVFPVGTEGFRRSGQAALGLHRYLAGKDVDGRTMHYEEARIELTGTFPGITSQQKMVDAIHVLTATAPESGMVLYVPGVFEREQFVLAETWDFNHAADDRTHSIDFSITFVRLGFGKILNDPRGTAPPPQPQKKTAPRGKASRVFTIKDGARTFQSIASIVYHNSGMWVRLADMNQTLVRQAHLGQHQIPNHRWPIGTKVHY
jgi:hypothetical protein